MHTDTRTVVHTRKKTQTCETLCLTIAVMYISVFYTYIRTSRVGSVNGDSGEGKRASFALDTA